MFHADPSVLNSVIFKTLSVIMCLEQIPYVFRPMTCLLKHYYPKDRVSNHFNVFSTGVDKCKLFVPLRGKLISFNPLNAKLNPICHLLALLGAHHIFHVSGLRVKREKSFASNISRLIYKEPFAIRCHLTPI